MVRPNRLKERLRLGHPSLGCWLHLASPIAAEVVAQAGYDAVVIDHEHGPGDLYNGILQMQAASGTAATTILRVPWNDPVYIKRALDTGAEGIIVPSVQNAAEARAAVAACRYPPEGIRGFANQVTRSAEYGARVEEYLAGLPERLIVICQIESPTAVRNIGEIAAVEGVDMLFIGPSDLAASAGHVGHPDDPAVLALIEEAIAATKAAGRALGSIPLPGRRVEAMLAGPFDFVISASDVALLRLGAQADVSAHRRA